MSDSSKVKLVFDVPAQNEAGFVGFMDDVMTVMEALQSDNPMTAWGDMKRLIIERLDSPDIDDNLAFFRSQSMQGLTQIIEALAKSLTPPKG